MNRTELQQRIIREIQEIYSFANRFENTNQTHQIDIDLALSKVRNLYDLLLRLNADYSYRSDYQNEEKSTIHKPIVNDSETSIKDIVQKDEPKKPDVTAEIKNQPDPNIIVEKMVEKTPLPVIKTLSTKAEEKPKKEITKQKKAENSHEIMADKFQTKSYIHNTIAKDKTEKKDVSSKLQSKPIKDINAAIGLNDKFAFIRELFKGDKNLYTETIQVLNNFDTFGNALTFLKENFEWDFEEENATKLIELVRRKYTN
ncbi:MAG: hypothetical protein AB7S50_06780 [Bacteroidales bacterium]